MIGSIAGVLAEANLSAYSMSKHALEALTDVLAIEMASDGVEVSIIEPGTFHTELANNIGRRLGQLAEVPDLSGYREPDEVASVVSIALFGRWSKRRYLVVTHEAEARQTIEKQIEQLVQLNENHTYAYSRDTLVSMLDAALTRTASRP
jgi:NAD(P)-dependent dehydrogenase (short-subunit alcohol dehydrogenase family)